MGKLPWAFRVDCDLQEWSGEDVPFCECKRFRGPWTEGKTGWYAKIKQCCYEICPRKKTMLKQLKRKERKKAA